MLDRLLGLETEYAIRFTPRGRSQRPRNDTVYEAIRAAISQLVLTRPGRLLSKQQFFCENGGQLSYEMLPFAPDSGLLEGATPECRGPSQALLYQKAQDHLVLAALPGAEALLRQQGYDGTVGFLKNCRDAEGHVYGAQENYQAEIARGPALWLWRAALVLLLPAVLLCAVITWACLAVVFVSLLAVMGGVGLAGLFSGHLRESRIYTLLFGDSLSLERALGKWMYLLERVIWEPLLIPFLALVRVLAFRRLRRDLLAFLVTRPVFTGAGTLIAGTDGASDAFLLSEKGLAVHREVRWTLSPDDRGIFEVGNLCKDLVDLMTLRVRSYTRLFHRRQRLQLGLSDSNMAHVAEYLKVAVTGLMIDMAEAGALGDIPRLRRPIAALGAIIRDPSLAVEVPVHGRPPMRALDIQRAYLDRARAFVERAETHSIEAVEIVKRWAEVLDALDHAQGTEPSRLVGRLDWITKKELIEQASRQAAKQERASGDAVGGEESFAMRKKIDLKYHELGTGYFAALEGRGLAPRLVAAGEIERALREPPEATPAAIRSMIIRNLGRSNETVRVSWSEVRIGGPIRGKVIRLDDYRD